MIPRVANFSKDVSDGENYTVLLNQLKPDVCSRAPLQTRDLHQRAEEVGVSFIFTRPRVPVFPGTTYLRLTIFSHCARCCKTQTKLDAVVS